MIEWIECPSIDCMSMFCSQYDCVYTLAATFDRIEPFDHFKGSSGTKFNRVVCKQVNDFVLHDINTNPPCEYVCLWTPFMLDFGSDNGSVSVYLRKRISTGAGHATLDDFDSFHVRPSKKMTPLDPIDLQEIKSTLAPFQAEKQANSGKSNCGSDHAQENTSFSSTSSFEKEQQMRAFMLQNDLDYLYE